MSVNLQIYYYINSLTAFKVIPTTKIKHDYITHDYQIDKYRK